MLLSIVECGNHLDFQGSQTTPKRQVLAEDVEWIGPVVGPSAAHMRNWGAQQAQGRWLFFKDPDCQIELDRLLRALKKIDRRQDSAIILGGPYRTHALRGWQRAYHQVQRRWVLRSLKRPSRDCLHLSGNLLGGALLMSRQRFYDLGGFSEQIGWGAEETEFLYRHHAHGGLSYYCPSLWVSHESHLSIAGFFKRAWKQNYNRGRYRLEHPSPQDRVSYFPQSRELWFWIASFFAVGWVAYQCGRFGAREASSRC